MTALANLMRKLQYLTKIVHIDYKFARFVVEGQHHGALFAQCYNCFEFCS